MNMFLIIVVEEELKHPRAKDVLEVNLDGMKKENKVQTPTYVIFNVLCLGIFFLSDLPFVAIHPNTCVGER